MGWILDLVECFVPWIQSSYHWIPISCVVLLFIVHFVRWIIEGGVIKYND